MDSILRTWGSMLRFLIVVFAIFLSIIYLIGRFADTTEFKIDYNNDKTLVTIIDKKTVVANSVLPACDCWANTGIEIRPGEEYELKVSGKVHAAADKLLNDTSLDKLPQFAWIGPEGDGDFRIRQTSEHYLADSIRQSLLLNRKANIGQVIFYLQRGSSQKPDCNLGPGFYNPDSILVYNSAVGITGTNESKEVLHVWASVNDMIIKDFQSDSNQIAYLGKASESGTTSSKLRSWEDLAAKNYNRIWFDDNFGNFVISGKIIRPLDYFSF